MGLLNLQPYLLAAQLVLQTALLLLLLVAAGRQTGETVARVHVLRAVAITLACVLVEAFLSQKAGWMILVPLAGVAVLVLINSSWAAMWSSCVSVMAFGAFFTLLTIDFGEVSEARQAQREAARWKHKQARAVRYSQVARELDHVVVPRKEEEPPPKPQEPAPTAPPVTQPPTAAAPTENPSDAVPVAAAEPIEVPAPEYSDTDWIIARSMITYHGRIRRNGRLVALIGEQMYSQHDVVSVIRNGVMHRWVIMEVHPHSLDLTRLDARGPN